MKTVAIVYSTKYGQTQKIAEYIGEHLRQKGFATHVHCIDGAGRGFAAGDGFDAVIAGGPVYREKFSPALAEWVGRNKRNLMTKTSAFFSVSLNAADHRVGCRAGDRRVLTRFLTRVRWSPVYVASFGGALKYREYNWFIRFILKRISAQAGGPVDTGRDHELTDWNVIDAFIEDFAHDDPQSKFTLARVLPQLEAVDEKQPDSLRAWS